MKSGYMLETGPGKRGGANGMIIVNGLHMGRLDKMDGKV